MVEMTKMKKASNLPFRSFILPVLMMAALFVSVAAMKVPALQQERTMVKLRHADEIIDQTDRASGQRLSRLLGNVEFIHKEITMFCDSAHFYPSLNQIEAYSRVHIEQGDTLDINGDYLFYDGGTENATLTGNVELVNKETHLFTDAVTYDVRTEVARYNTGGRIINKENTLSSITGVYYVAEDLFHFKDSVKIVNPDYVMTADTMDYNTETEISVFTGPSELRGDSLYLYCEKGWYDTRNDISRIWKNALIDNKKQIIKGDSLFYDAGTGYGQSFGNISISDTTNNLEVRGEYAWYYREPERFMVTEKALFIQVSGEDSLFLHADTISSVSLTDTTGSWFRLMRAYRGCRIFSEDLQARCDSLSYSFRDSVIRFYHEPVIWSQKSQLTADSLALFTRNRQADKLLLYSSSFIVEEVDTTRYNQIKGRSLTGYFRENDLYRIVIEGNGETIYFLTDNDEVVGINHAKCSSIDIYLEDGKIREIFELENPEGIIDPPGKPHKELKLEGFAWYDSLRPKKKSDIFIKN